MTKNTTDYPQACKLRDFEVAQDTEREWRRKSWADINPRLCYRVGGITITGAPGGIAAHTETELREVIVGMGWSVSTYMGAHGSLAAAMADSMHMHTEFQDRPTIDTLVDLLTQILEGEK